MQSTFGFIETDLMLAPYFSSINYCSGLSAGYQLNTTTIRREVDDHSVVNPFTRGSIEDLLADFLYPPREFLTDHCNTSTTSTSGQKRHQNYATPNDSKKFKGDGYSISGEEVVTPLASQSGNLLSSPTGAVSTPNYGEVWINILEEPEEVYKQKFHIHKQSL